MEDEMMTAKQAIAQTPFGDRHSPYSTGSVEHSAYCAGWQTGYRVGYRMDEPLSGEFADGPDRKVIVVQAWLDSGVSSREAWMHANDDWEDDSEILDAWELGYADYFAE